MLKFVARRLSVMALTALVLTFVVFFLTNLQPNLEKLARSEGSVRMTDDAVDSWIIKNGHGGSSLYRYSEWLGVTPGWTFTDEKGKTHGRCIRGDLTVETAPTRCGILQGNWGYSTSFKKPVLEVVGRAIGATGVDDTSLGAPRLQPLRDLGRIGTG